MSSIMKVLKTCDKILSNFMKALVVILCSAIAIVLFLRVIIRFTPVHFQISWTDEIVEMMMAWLIFTASAEIMRDGGHFRVELLQERYAGKKWVDFLNLFISILSIVFIASLLYYSIQLVQKAVQFTPILKISTRWLYLSIPVNCVIMLIYLIRDAVNNVLKIAGKKTAEPEKAA